MLNKKKASHPIVHLAIDVQSRYLHKLSLERQQEYPQAVRDFADRLRAHDIPTIWVALLGESRLHARRAEWSAAGGEKRREKQLAKFDLLRVTAHKDEDVFIKKANNAFEPPLTKRLREYDTRTLVITGMNTRYCVAATAFGAVSENFRSLVVTDLLADMGVHDLLDIDTAWHRKNVESALHKMLEKNVESPGKRAAMFASVEYCTTQDLFAAQRKSPLLAKKLAMLLCGRKRKFD